MSNQIPRDVNERQCSSIRQQLKLLEQYRTFPLEELGAQERLMLFSAIKDRLQRALLTVSSTVSELRDIVDDHE